MGFGIKKDVTANVTPSTIVYFDKATPTEVGVVFTPNTPATTDVLYVSSVDASTWIWDGLDYITYSAPSTSSTEWYLFGTTIDAGSNKTATIQRSGAIYVNADSYFNGVIVGRGSGNVSNNTVVGDKALISNTTGSQIVALGYGALQNNSTGSNNSAIGWGALANNSTGSGNGAFGNGALQSNITGSNSSAIGYQAGRFLGDGTTANITPQNSVFLGYGTRSFTNNDTNQIVIGYNAIGKGSNTVQIGNTSITDTYLQGAVTFNNAYKLPTTAPTSGQVLGYLGAGTTQWLTSGGGGIVGIANASGVYTYYATLTLAMTAAVSGNTIELFADIVETGSVAITLKSGVKINGNGHTYTLSVNDNTNALICNSGTVELFNWKIVRTGRSNGAGGYVLNCLGGILKANGVIMQNTYGDCVIDGIAIYGLNAIAYLNGFSVVNENTKHYKCIGESTGTGNGILSTYSVGCTGIAVSGSGIIGNGTHLNSTGISTSGTGISGQTLTGCIGISTSGTGASASSGLNCIGISTSGYGGSGVFYNSTLISSSGNGLGGIGSTSMYNSYAQSSSNVATTNASIYNSTVKCLWNNVGGNCTATFALGSKEILNSFLEVTNASAYCITGYSGSTWKFANNSYKGATTAVNTTNIAQGIINTSDLQGNILI